VTPQQAEAYAEKVLAALDRQPQCADEVHCSVCQHEDDARQQVHSALRALHRAEEGLALHEPMYQDGGGPYCNVAYCEFVEGWPCPDARRYAEARDDALDDLRRLGRLYGAGETNAPGKSGTHKRRNRRTRTKRPT
jgi:hypothetical protein